MLVMNKLPTINDRFMQVLESMDYTPYKFAKEVDEVSQTTIANIKSGRSKPSHETITALCLKFTRVNARWLITGVGEMFGTEGGENDTSLDGDVFHVIELHDFRMKNSKPYRDWFDKFSTIKGREILKDLMSQMPKGK